MLNDFVPILLPRISYWRGDETEVLASIIRTDIEKIPDLVDVVLVAFPTRQENSKWVIGVVSRNSSGFAGRFACGDKNDITSASSSSHVEVVELIFLFIEQFRSRVSQNKPVEPVRTFGNRIFLRVEERLFVVGPCQ